LADKQASLQDLFLNQLRKGKTPVTMFLVKGVKLQGIVTWFDNFSVLLRRDGQSQLIYKHAISTIMPGAQADLEPVVQQVIEAQQRGQLLQGHIAAFDQFCMLLQREGTSQLVYKHAVSTIQPAQPLNLAEEQALED
jgi:host factor-I protein